MKKLTKTGWKHPGKRSSDYGRALDHDHDLRHVNLSGKGPSISDDWIKDKVCELMYWDKSVDARNIEVSVNGGVVTLTGTVDSRHAKKKAERIIDEVAGVRDVQNDVIIHEKLDIMSDKIVTRGDDGLFTEESIEH